MKKALYRILVLICLLAMGTLSVSAAGNSMNIYGLYLSQEGDATLMESNGKWLLIDTGLDICADELMKKLQSYGVTELDVLISHTHTDHTGGFDALADSTIKINRLYLPDASLTPHDEHTETKHNRLIRPAQANNPNVTVTYLKKGSTFAFGDVKATVLGPVANISPDDFTATEDQTEVEQYVNCRSLTVRFDCGTVSYLTAGDIEAAEEKALVKAYSGTSQLNVDIMKLSHHALYTSNTEEFIAAVSPRYSFGQNSNKTINEGMDYRMYYTSCTNASAYGPVYLVGDEKQDFKATVSNGSISIFKGNQELKGLVTLVGGDGTKVKTYKYYITGGDVKEGVYTIDGKKYYVSDGGFVNKAFYSHNLDKYVYRYEPVEGGDVRYFDLEGVMYTGFRKINDNYFYFDTETGILLKGDKDFSPIAIGSKKYAVNENGAVYNYGAKSGAWKKYGTNYRYFDKDGVMQTGWVTVDGKKYYLDPSTGLRTIGLKEIDGKSYYFVETNNAGYLWTSGWKEFDGNYRYFDKDGIMKTGWLTVDGKKYYLDKSTGLRTIGLKKISKKTYYFVETNNAGYLWTSGWKKFDGKYRYFDKDGVMLTGWQTIDGKDYYLNKSTGFRETGFVKLDGKYYYVKDGKKSKSTGFVKVDGKYYQIKKGVRVTSAPYVKCDDLYIRLSTTEYTYNGKTKKPSIKIYDKDGDKVSSKYYSVKYASGRKNVGKYKVTVKLKGKYSGSKKLYFTINPTGTEIDKISASKGSLKVYVEKKSKQVTGYQIQYSTDKDFDSATVKSISSYKTVSKKLSGLEAKKTYYVRVRTYKTVDGTKFYSDWSDSVAKKTK